MSQIITISQEQALNLINIASSAVIAYKTYLNPKLNLPALLTESLGKISDGMLQEVGKQLLERFQLWFKQPKQTEILDKIRAGDKISTADKTLLSEALTNQLFANTTRAEELTALMDKPTKVKVSNANTQIGIGGDVSGDNNKINIRIGF
jgi:hypothetical protein